MKKQILLAVMAATSLGSLQAAEPRPTRLTSEQQKEKLKALRVEVDKEHAALAADNNEDKKYALIQRISKTQQAYDSFVTQALYFYRMHAKQSAKAQLKLHFEKATQNIQKLEALMACAKQTLDPDNVDFEKDMKSFKTGIETFERLCKELTKSLQALKKDSPEVL